MFPSDERVSPEGAWRKSDNLFGVRALRTARLRLIPVSVQNAGAMWNLLQAPDLRTYQDLPSVGMAAFSQMVLRRPKRLRAGSVGRFEWLIYGFRKRGPLGWVSLRIAARDTQVGEIGYSVMGEFRSKGVATESVRALVTEAFERTDIDRISAYCLPENAPSRRVLSSLGFSEAELVAHGASVSGRPVDILHHTLYREAGVQSANSMDIPASA
ncbi:MAG: hypothetical protein DLM50_02835 [Candidatus Meridianibacter frigidus]|nr:MAG: hypothetical protein DLM50_02835 [Candidatus Eremiobacteraeota bacterium]